MRLGESVESALHLCVLLAALPAGGALSAAQLAEFHALPPAATAKLLQQLAAAGVLEAREGRSGGYRLARPPDAVSVADIVAAADGSQPAFRCREIRRQGPCAGGRQQYSARCAIAHVMDEAQDAWWHVLEGWSLGALGRRVAGQLEEGIRDRSQRWLREKARP